MHQIKKIEKIAELVQDLMENGGICEVDRKDLNEMTRIIYRCHGNMNRNLLQVIFDQCTEGTPHLSIESAIQDLSSGQIVVSFPPIKKYFRFNQNTDYLKFVSSNSEHAYLLSKLIVIGNLDVEKVNLK
jgi:hypothetical protein